MEVITTTRAKLPCGYYYLFGLHETSKGEWKIRMQCNDPGEPQYFVSNIPLDKAKSLAQGSMKGWSPIHWGGYRAGNPGVEIPGFEVPRYKTAARRILTRLGVDWRR